MRAKISLVIVGIVILIFGIIFCLQGNSIVGPTTSFMYSNPKWIEYGQWIAAIGVVILAVGIGVSLRLPRS
jgi:hypothetical protein